jgi:hypothetical protein
MHNFYPLLAARILDDELRHQSNPLGNSSSGILETLSPKPEDLESHRSPSPKPSLETEGNPLSNSYSSLTHSATGLSTSSTTTSNLPPIESKFRSNFLKNGLARKVTMYYVLTVLKKWDLPAVEQLLGSVNELRSSVVEEPAFTQSLLNLALYSKSNALRQLTVDSFLFKLPNHSIELHLQLLHFVVMLSPRIQLKETLSYLHRLISICLNANWSTTDKNSKIKPAYQQLIEKLPRVNRKHFSQIFEFLGISQHHHPAVPSSLSSSLSSSSQRHSPAIHLTEAFLLLGLHLQKPLSISFSPRREF